MSDMFILTSLGGWQLAAAVAAAIAVICATAWWTHRRDRHRHTDREWGQPRRPSCRR